MRNRSLFWPISLVVAMAIAIVASLMLSSVPPGTSLAQGCATDTAGYPSPQCLTQTAQACGDVNNPGYPICKQTQTAAAQQTAGTGGATSTTRPSNTATTQSAPPSSGGGGEAAAATATPTFTATSTATPTRTSGSGATPTVGTPAAATPTVGSDEAASPTPTPEVAIDLTCVPGERLTITGQAPPATALLLAFNPRVEPPRPATAADRVVGGAVSTESGFYTISMIVGEERPGLYDLLVRVRDTNQVLRSLICEVPNLEPTATPPLVR